MYKVGFMNENKLEKAISAKTAKRIYDFIGKRYDWFGGYDAHAKARAFELLGMTHGQYLLEVGVGTGKEHVRMLAVVMQVVSHSELTSRE
jgi:ubiquinone/menaquinone biosynthesis C-methylase UbiE